MTSSSHSRIALQNMQKIMISFPLKRLRLNVENNNGQMQMFAERGENVRAT